MRARTRANPLVVSWSHDHDTSADRSSPRVRSREPCIRCANQFPCRVNQAQQPEAPLSQRLPTRATCKSAAQKFANVSQRAPSGGRSDAACSTAERASPRG